MKLKLGVYYNPRINHIGILLCDGVFESQVYLLSLKSLFLEWIYIGEF